MPFPGWRNLVSSSIFLYCDGCCLAQQNCAAMKGGGVGGWGGGGYCLSDVQSSVCNRRSWIAWGSIWWVACRCMAGQCWLRDMFRGTGLVTGVNVHCRWVLFTGLYAQGQLPVQVGSCACCLAQCGVVCPDGGTRRRLCAGKVGEGKSSKRKARSPTASRVSGESWTPGLAQKDPAEMCHILLLTWCGP
jgi:hypothetical protein